jgi:two-component system, OmpR family, sensor kinase
MRSFEKRSLINFILLYSSGIMFVGALVLSWYGFNENKRIGKEYNLSVKLYEKQCSRLLRLAPSDYQCTLEKPQKDNDVKALIQEIVFMVIMITIVALVMSYFLALQAIKPMREAYVLMDNFIASMVHDLNTPIAAAQLNLDSLYNEEIQSQNQVKRQKRVGRALSMLSDLQYQLKSSVSEAKLIFNDEVVDVVELIMIESEIEPLITIELPKEFEIVADKLHTQRVISNLISNAVKYNRDNSSIMITLRDTKLCIKDRGIGIENPERIFERYYREKSSMQGMGIGLGIVKLYCDNYGFKIDVRSQLGVGTEVEIDFKSENKT